MTSQDSSVSISVEQIATTQTSSILESAKSGLHIATYLQYSTAARVGPYIYMGGVIGQQRNANAEHSSMMAVLNIKLMAWHWIPYKGSSSAGSCTFLYEDGLFSLGPNDYMRKNSGKLSRFDLSLNEWSYCHTVGDGPGPRAYFSGHLLEKFNRSRFIVFGGVERSTVSLLEIPEFRWVEATASGTPAPGRFQHGSCLHEGVIYIYGGYRGGQRIRDDLYLLEVGSGRKVRWSSPRTNAAAFGVRSSFLFISAGRILLMCGGYTNTGDAGLAYYDPDLQEFNRVRENPQMLRLLGYGACGCPIENGRTFAILGGRNTFNLITATVSA